MPFMEEQKMLQQAIFEVFKKEMHTLSPDLRSILIEDMITSFYNRLNVLKKIQQDKNTR